MNRRLLVLLLCLGLLLGVVFGLTLRAQDDEGIIVKPIHPCDTFEPYSYLWYAFYCDLRESEAITAETLTVDADGVITVDRTYVNGRRVIATGRKVRGPQ